MGAAALLVALAACGPRHLTLVQRSHGREFRCDWRYVRVERGERTRFVGRGCGFEADWECADGACRLLDARTYGAGAP